MGPITGLIICMITMAVCIAAFPDKPKQKAKTDDQKLLDAIDGYLKKGKR